MKRYAQICFAGDADLEKVKTQLQELKDKDEYKFFCCFLPRHIVVEKGFNTEIVDILEEVLGDDLEWMLKDATDFSVAMSILSEKRLETAELVHKMFVLDSGTAKGVRAEIDLFTKSKVILMP